MQRHDPRTGGALKFASERLKDDEEVVTAAVETNGWAITHASPRLQKNARIQNIALSRVALRPEENERDAMLDFIKMLVTLDSAYES